jgi:hypothetical protein
MLAWRFSPAACSSSWARRWASASSARSIAIDATGPDRRLIRTAIPIYFAEGGLLVALALQAIGWVPAMVGFGLIALLAVAATAANVLCWKAMDEWMRGLWLEGTFWGVVAAVPLAAVWASAAMAGWVEPLSLLGALAAYLPIHFVASLVVIVVRAPQLVLSGAEDAS